MKTCTKCGVHKPLEAFAIQEGRQHGVSSNCKQCKRAAWAVSYAANPESESTRKAAAYAANPAVFQARIQRYASNNAAKLKASSAAWARANRDKTRIYTINYRASLIGQLSPDIAAKLYELQRGTCPCCKQLLGEDYHLDHIMPIALGGSNTDDNIQLLRATCNHQKCAKHPVDFMQSRGFLI